MMDAPKLDLSNPREAHADQRLRENVMIWLNTVRPDGRPHSVPVYYVWDSESSTILIFSSLDQKIRNIRGNPRVMVTVDNTAEGTDVVMIEGVAKLLDPAIVKPTMPAYANKYAEILAKSEWVDESGGPGNDQPILVRATRFLIW